MERTAEGREVAPKLIAQSRHRGEEGTHEMDQHLWPPGPIVEGGRTRGLYYGHVRITAPHFRECPREWARSTGPGEWPPALTYTVLLHRQVLLLDLMPLLVLLGTARRDLALPTML